VLQRGPLIFLAVVLVALLPFLLQIALPFLTPFILALILAIVMNPVKNRLNLRIHRPGLTAFIITFTTVIVLGTILAFAGLALTGELTSAYDRLSRRSLEEGGWPALVTHTTDRVLDAFSTRLHLNKEAIRAELLDRMKSITGFLLNRVGTAIGGVTSILITGLLVTLFLYFLLRYGGNWIGRLRATIPLDSGATDRLFRTIYDSVVANVGGVLAVVLGQGLLLSLGFWFLDVRSPVLWGMIGGLASIIPIVGAPLIWVPVVIAFIFMGLYWKAVVLGLWGGLVVGSVDNVVRPLVVGGRENQHPMLLALAMIGGTYAFGALGIILGPLLVSLAAALVREMQRLVTPGAVVPTHPVGEMRPAANPEDSIK